MKWEGGVLPIAYGWGGSGAAALASSFSINSLQTCMYLIFYAFLKF
jgi:pantoate kinase